MAMNAAVASSLISGGAGLLGTIGNMFFQSGANDKNIQIARENRDFYYQQWMRENAYNDPSAMMQRLARAGLNPNLIYGDGASGMPAAASMPSVEAARVSAPQVDPLAMAQAANIAADTALKKAQVDKTESDIRVNEGIIKVNDSVSLYNSALTSMTKAQQDKCIAEMKFIADQQRELQSRIDVNLATIERMDAQSNIDWYNAFINDKTADAQIDKLAAERGWIDEQKKYYKEYIFSVVSDNRASAKLKEAESKLTDEQKKQVKETTRGLKISNNRVQIQLDLDNAGFAKTERELEQLRVTADICQSAAASMDEINGVRNVPKDVKSAATNSANKAANRTGTRRQ